MFSHPPDQIKSGIFISHQPRPIHIDGGDRDDEVHTVEQNDVRGGVKKGWGWRKTYWFCSPFLRFRVHALQTPLSKAPGNYCLYLIYSTLLDSKELFLCRCVQLSSSTSSCTDSFSTGWLLAEFIQWILKRNFLAVTFQYSKFSGLIKHEVRFERI